MIELYSYTVITLSVVIITTTTTTTTSTTNTTTENFIRSGFNKLEYDKSKGKFACTQTLCFESR